MQIKKYTKLFVKSLIKQDISNFRLYKIILYGFAEGVNILKIHSSAPFSAK